MRFLRFAAACLAVVAPHAVAQPQVCGEGAALLGAKPTLMSTGICESSCRAVYLTVGCYVCVPPEAMPKSRWCGTGGARLVTEEEGRLLWFKPADESSDAENAAFQSAEVRSREAARVAEEARVAVRVKEIEREGIVRREAENRAADEAEKHARANAPQTLRAMGAANVCSIYGAALRDESISSAGLPRNAAPLLAAEVRRRGLSVDVSLARAERVRVGMSECSLFASWGVPRDRNRTVTATSVRVQFIYGRSGPYVYTDGARVTAFQD